MILSRATKLFAIALNDNVTRPTPLNAAGKSNDGVIFMPAAVINEN
jgi:hypothetical protein